MTDTNIAASDDSASASITPAVTADQALTPREAHQAYTSRREKSSQAPAPAPEKVETKELAEEANAAPPEEATGETQAIDPVEEPPLELPRSWTKEQAEHWAALPRSTQEFLTEQASKASAEVRRSQNEAAEKLKGLTAKEQAVEQVRQQYESALPAMLQTLQSDPAWADIRTMDDVARLAVEDPFRKIQWDTHQQKLAWLAQENQKAEQRQAHERQTKWAEFAKQQDALLVEHVPEFADKAKAAKLSDAALETLRDLGFSDDELGKLWTGQADVPLRDHRIQRLIINSVKYEQAQKAKAVAVAKPVPQVQKPGVAQPKGSVADANVQALNSKLKTSGSVNDAFALYQARKKAG